MPKATEAQILAAARLIDPTAFLTLREIAAAHGMDADNPPKGTVFSEKPDDPLLSHLPRREAAIELAVSVAAVFDL